jgi:hypothetical protein
MDKHFKLESDLDFGNRKFYLIAERPYIFTGTFDGAGYTIRNLLIEPVFKTSSAGFIGTLKGASASIKNLMLIDPNVAADWGFGVGSLAGKNIGGSISNCQVLNGRVWGVAAVGGLVGNNYMYASISNCSVTGDIAENTFLNILSSATGGLVGENSFYSKIENSYAKCTVSGDDCVGGLTGSNLIYSTLGNCYAGGSVTGTASYIGGLVGRNLGATQANYCYSSASVVGPSDTGSTGGFAGSTTVSNCIYTACFWDSQINVAMPGIGNKTDPNVLGKTTTQMQTQATFADWDFADTWAICEGTNYPRLQWQIPAGDLVCPDGINFMDFVELATCWRAAVELSADINGSSRVDLVDMAALAGYWMQSSCGDCGGADVSGDSNVNTADLEIMIDQWLLNRIPECSAADISDDGFIGIEDLVMFSDNWLEGVN